MVFCVIFCHISLTLYYILLEAAQNPSLPHCHRADATDGASITHHLCTKVYSSCAVLRHSHHAGQHRYGRHYYINVYITIYCLSSSTVKFEP